MIESIVTTYCLRCDRCQVAWVRVTAGHLDEARQEAQAVGWGFKIGLGDVCPRCVRKV